MSEEFIIDKFDNGSIQVSENVIATIAYTSCEKIDGVVNFQRGIKQGALDMLGYKNQARGVKVSVSEHSTVVDIYVRIEYGRNLVEISKTIQETVRESIDNMLDIEDIMINVHVIGIEMMDGKIN
ncbi:Asp23/Gls24 family envelope stress response protein [Peptoniphilus sp. GNH]|nr:Asp23/Gls24 family envelope stress response protein [Peptoniphilus sp. GNH]